MTTSHTLARSIDRSITRSVGASPELLSHFAELFAGLPALGCMPSHVLAMLARSGVKRTAKGMSPLRVLDLGCGQGAMTVALAKKLGCEVVAVDACPAFLQAAHELADDENVSDRCWFGCEDAGAFARRKDQREAFDIAIMLNLWPAPKAAKALMPLVRQGGFIIVDDATLHTSVRGSIAGTSRLSPIRKGQGLLTPHALKASLATIAKVQELLMLEPKHTKRTYAAMAKQLRKNVDHLASRDATLHKPLAKFLTQHLIASAAMHQELRPTIALLRK